MIKDHYSNINQSISQEISGIKSKGKKIAEIREGYILLDTKNKLVINQQNCINITPKKGFSLII
jgi:hypothetical protein